MNLAKALRITGKARVTFVGAGGKTTAMFTLARQLPAPVLLTTTTHLADSQTTFADHHIILNSPVDLDDVERKLPEGVILFSGESMQGGRVGGLGEVVLARLNELAGRRGLTLLIEADGSKQKPLKAPDAHEPAIPDIEQDLVVVVAGLAGLGKPLTQDWVHRPQIFARLAGISPGSPITGEAIGRVLTHVEGGLKGIPKRTRRVALLNQAETPSLIHQGNIVAQQLLPAYHAVILAALHPPEPGQDRGEVKKRKTVEPAIISVHEPVDGIVLAAGGSRRLGRPKQLLLYKGKTLVRHAVEAGLAASLRSVVVVIGAHGEEVKAALEDLPVRFVENPHWETGQSTSIRAGLQALPDGTGAAVFLLGDQPNTPPDLIRKLVEVHRRTLAPLIAPRVEERRGNPVLFDRETFMDLENLSGDVGGRALFSRYTEESVEWQDEKAMVDVDTEEDYRKLISG
jgi:molybdenum cofactor cytidylyltransferase